MQKRHESRMKAHSEYLQKIIDYQKSMLHNKEDPDDPAFGRKFFSKGRHAYTIVTNSHADRRIQELGGVGPLLGSLGCPPDDQTNDDDVVCEQKSTSMSGSNTICDKQVASTEVDKP